MATVATLEVMFRSNWADVKTGISQVQTSLQNLANGSGSMLGAVSSLHGAFGAMSNLIRGPLVGGLVDFGSQAVSVAGPPHLRHGAVGAGESNGMFRMVAWVSDLICASHSALPHHGDLMNPGRPAINFWNSS